MFSKQWQTYIDLWFAKHLRFDFQDLIATDRFLLWGIVQYKKYMTSEFFKYNPIQLANKELNIYYYVRRLENDNLYLYFFANTTDFKSKILASQSQNVDELFLKRLYEHSVSFYQLFFHDYSENCWTTLNEQKHLFIE